MYQEQTQEPRLGQRLIARLRFIICDTDFEFSEFLSCLTAVLVGAWLLNPAWDTFGASPSYSLMAYVAPEWAWGLALLAVGVVQAYAIAVGRSFWRKTALLAEAFVWAVSGIMFAMSNPSSTGTVIHFVLAAPAGWAYWRLMVQRES